MLYADLAAQHYMDQAYGVVSNTQGTCDNYHLFSSEAAIISNWNIWPQYAIFYKACEVEPGLITRYPGRIGGGISQDELFGAATLDEHAAQRILEYGNNNHWIFNPDKIKFDWKSPWQSTKILYSMWLGRFIDLQPYVKLRAGGGMTIWEQLKWSIMTALSPLSEYGNTSGKLLKFSQIRAVEGRYWICDKAIAFWKNRMNKMYPGGLQEIMTIYFGSKHPMTLCAPKDFK